MTPIALIMLGLAALLFIIEVVLGFSFPGGRDETANGKNYPWSKKTTVAEFFGQELPFVYLLIGLPLLVASPGDGAFVLGLAAASFVLSKLSRQVRRKQ